MTLKQTQGQYEADYINVNTPVKKMHLCRPLRPCMGDFSGGVWRLSQVSSQGGGGCEKKEGSAVQRSNELPEVIPRIQGIYYRQLREGSRHAVCVDPSQTSELLFHRFRKKKKTIEKNLNKVERDGSVRVVPVVMQMCYFKIQCSLDWTIGVFMKTTSLYFNCVLRFLFVFFKPNVPVCVSFPFHGRQDKGNKL